MSALLNLSIAANVAVIGASGGIGAEFTRQLGAAPHIAQVHAFSRTPIQRPDDKVLAGSIDITDEESILAAALAASAEAPLDAVIVAPGVLHGTNLRPEKSLGEIEADAMLDVMRTNAVGPALLARHFLPRMRRDAKSKNLQTCSRLR